MKLAMKKKFEGFLNKLPDSKLLLWLTIAILLGVLLYVIILFI
jgi:hypothetical protein